MIEMRGQVESKMVRLALIDYEAGNLRSIGKALARAGADVTLLREPEARGRYDGIVLPGVGAFGPAMKRLGAAGVVEWIRTQVDSGTPLIGVCLGMQLLFGRSEEGGDVRGLGLLPGAVVRLQVGLKVPHMGWNQLVIRRRSDLLDRVGDGVYAYFVHSYVVNPGDERDVVATTAYGIEFPAIVQRGRIVGLQFHPEKSAEVGLRILRNVVAWVASNADGSRVAGAVPTD